MDTVRDELYINKSNKTNTLCLIYYAGHGCMKNNVTQAVLND